MGRARWSGSRTLKKIGEESSWTPPDEREPKDPFIKRKLIRRKIKLPKTTYENQ